MGTNHTPLDPQQVQQASLPHKEAEPVVLDAQSSEMVQPKEKEISPEVVEYIKQRDQVMNVPKDLKDLGVSAGTDEALSDKNGPHLAISDEEIVEGLHQPVTSSWRWLAELMKYILLQAHYTFKTVHGHVKRVLTS